MRLSSRTCMRAVAAGVGLLALSIPVGAASASGLTLSLAASSTPVVGNPMILHATGTIPPQDLEFPYWFSLDAIPTGVTSTCPPDAFEGSQIAVGSGGSNIVVTQREIPDAAGNFSIPVAVTPSAPGSVLLCAYTDDGAAATLAAASLILNIQPKPSSQPKPSTSQPKPSTTGPSSAGIVAQTRGGIRSCLALLGPKDARGCIRSQVRLANGRCRRLHSPHSRTACLRGVRALAKRYS